MNESTLFLIAFILYIAAAFFYFIYLFTKKKALAKQGYWSVAAGLVFHTAALILRIFESGHAPFTNMYESLSFLAWSGAAAYVIVEGKFKIRKAGPYFMLIVIGLMALASSPLMPKEATPLVPALQSYWLWLHVSVTLFGEAFFAIAFVTSIMYLVAESREKKGKASASGLTAERLDSISYRSVAVGFPVFTPGRAHFWNGLGLQSLGDLLELGSQGGLEPDHLVCVRPLPPYPAGDGLEGPEIRYYCYHRLFGRDFLPILA